MIGTTIQPAPAWRELPLYEQRDIYWWYYENNGLYDALRSSGYLANEPKLMALRNPAFRAVEWYAATVWSGPPNTAHPMVLDMPAGRHAAFEAAISKLQRWSNWSSVKQEIVRDAAICGVGYLKVAQPADGSRRVYLQRLDAGVVSEERLDERGYITYIRLDTAEDPATGGVAGWWRTEVWDRERVRIWRHQRARTTKVEQLGMPVEEIALSAWGIDFVPVVRFPHLILRGQPAGCFFAALEKIDELNRQATRLHRLVFRKNDVVWALEANTVDATGRPVAAPKIGSSLFGAEETVELAGERLVRLPGMSKLVPLIPNINYADALALIGAQMAEIEADLPETLWHKLRDIPELSGRAIRLIMSPARARTVEVRGNHEAALVRAHQMALTIGAAIGAFDEREIGTYQNGDFEHHFAERPVLPLAREEVAELAQVEVGAGMPLTTSLRRSGWTEEELEELAADKAAEAEAQQASMATALLNAQEQFAAGGQSNGLEQPEA